MTTLFVAAGGGGDALGVLLARRILDPSAVAPALISTCAWERLRIDPEPGPRHRSGFTHLGPVGTTHAEILPTTETVPTGRSVLPRLAANTTARLFLHDFERGAVGLADQLSSLATALGAAELVVLDVGGDIVARGNEPTLLSPLADSTTLAAALLTGLPTRLAVLGPGVDGELPADQVVDTLVALGAVNQGAVVRDDVEPLAYVLAWHPTEATMLAAAGALGVEGAVDMRRGQAPTPLTPHSATVWTLDQPRFDDFPLAQALSATRSLDEAEEIMRQVAINELDYERQRSLALTDHAIPPETTASVVAASSDRGATHITTRRLLEATGTDLSAKQQARVAGLGLWSLTALSPRQRTSGD